MSAGADSDAGAGCNPRATFQPLSMRTPGSGVSRRPFGFRLDSVRFLLDSFSVLFAGCFAAAIRNYDQVLQIKHTVSRRFESPRGRKQLHTITFSLLPHVLGPGYE